MIFELNKLAAAGDIRAQVQLAMHYLRKLEHKLPEKALTWVERQSLANDPNTLLVLTQVLLDHNGANGETELGMHLLTSAAQADTDQQYSEIIANYQFWCGCLNLNGQGVPADETKAMDWFEKAAQRDHHQAQELLATLNNA